MKNNKLLRIVQHVGILIFWLLVWETTAKCVDLSFALPSVKDAALSLLHLLPTAAFWKNILFSFARIFLGLMLGAILGGLLAVIASVLPFLNDLIKPAMSFIRATPVASFILILWVLIGKNAVPVAIAVLMVMPILYQNVLAGIVSLDKKKAEVLKVFHVSPQKRFRVFLLPAVLQYVVPSFISAVGLAWKAGIAAEIIAYTKDSIGRSILDAKNDFNGADMFAWTVVVIIFSIGLEKLLHYLGKKVSNGAHTH